MYQVKVVDGGQQTFEACGVEERRKLGRPFMINSVIPIYPGPALFREYYHQRDVRSHAPPESQQNV